MTFGCGATQPEAAPPPSLAAASDAGASSTEPPVPARPDAAAASASASPPAPVPTPAQPPTGPVGSERGPNVTIHTHTNRPVVCNAKQTNTPCIFKKSDACLLRHMNCERLPCTESAPEPVACSAAIAPLRASTPVCLEVRGLPHNAFIAVFRDSSNSDNGAGPLGDAVTARVCGDANRVWKIEVEAPGASFEGEVDWRKAACFTVDLDARSITAKCANQPGVKSYQNRL
jgi:hypothetical protein